MSLAASRKLAATVFCPECDAREWDDNADREDLTFCCRACGHQVDADNLLEAAAMVAAMHRAADRAADLLKGICHRCGFTVGPVNLDPHSAFCPECSDTSKGTLP